MRVIVLHNHVPPEAAEADQDTLVQVQAVERELARLGHETARLAVRAGTDTAAAADGVFGPAERERIAEADAVFNLVESYGGAEHAHLAARALEDLGAPFTGSGSEPLRRSTGKLLAKQTLQAAGLATPAWADPADPAAGDDVLGGTGSPTDGGPGDWIVKSVWEHASLGLDQDAVLRGADAAAAARAARGRAAAHGGSWFAERFVHGREFNLAVLETVMGGPLVLPPAEIDFAAFGPERARIVGQAAKWDEGSFEYENTPRRFDFPEADRPLLRELGRLALACWRAFDLRGYARVDFRVDGDGKPWIIDVNANPCLSPDAGFAAALARTGMSLGEAVAAVLEVAADGAGAGADAAAGASWRTIGRTIGTEGRAPSAREGRRGQGRRSGQREARE
ncbi:MAG: D-alanine--D-alanine ligase [Desulfovibrionaceae bacterium]|jgi:D-alanine-D-alanine ligase|nr:D-alanine--D-alanine ligase [Desulfovibrionaceae bacterium]